MKIPENYRLTFSHEQIAHRVKALGALIAPWAEASLQASGKQVLAICVLRGGVFFFTDLLRSIDTSIEPTFCRTWSYSSAENLQSGHGVRVSVEDVVAEGRAVLIVDDICDTGATLLKLHNVFLGLGAGDVKTAVLVHRRVENTVYTPTWSAFDYYGPDWIVGYGMEDCNCCANLPDVYVISA